MSKPDSLLAYGLDGAKTHEEIPLAVYGKTPTELIPFWILDFPAERYANGYALLYERLRLKRSYAAGFTTPLRLNSVERF
ncbi:hypothetical protein [Nostoc sp.]|uniref:hypothetical protein n=1 Tax=Nostoc sp. TaxID=1180 RepID=UPI002FF94E9E